MTSAPATESTVPPPRGAWRRTAAYWLGALGVYWLTLFAATHTPDTNAAGPFLSFDKALHAGAYFVLTTLLLIAWRRTGAWPTWRGRLAVAAIALAYGAVDEITQPYFERQCELLDWLFDGLGIALAIGLDHWRHGGSER